MWLYVLIHHQMKVIFCLAGLVGKKAQRQQQVARKIEELLLTFAELLMVHPSPGRAEPFQYSETVPLCVHYCLAVELRSDNALGSWGFVLSDPGDCYVRGPVPCSLCTCSGELFERLYTILSAEPQARACFLESLPKHILDGELSTLAPSLAKDLVSQLAVKQQFSTLEKCIVHLDIACLDIHQVPEKFSLGLLSWRKRLP